MKKIILSLCFIVLSLSNVYSVNDEDYVIEHLTEFSEYLESEYTKGKYYLYIEDKLGNHTMDIGNGYKFIYTVYLGNDNLSKKGKFKFSYTDQKGNVTYSNEINNVNFLFSEFNNPSIAIYNNKVIVETGAGHEGISRGYYFDFNKVKVYDIYQDIVTRNLGYKANPVYDMYIENDFLFIKEFKYCCDTIYNFGGYEKHTFDLKTFQLISSKLIEEIDKSELNFIKSDIFFKEYVTIFPEKYGYSINEFKDDYKINNKYIVLNNDIINKYEKYIFFSYNSYFGFYGLKGKLYKDNNNLNYIEITDLGELSKSYLDLQLIISKKNINDNSNLLKYIGKIDDMVDNANLDRLKKVYKNFLELEYNFNKKTNDKYIDVFNYLEAKIGLRLYDN